jgi:holo-[acyl-carrier protein] synthase
MIVGTGIDLIEVDRIRRAVERHGDRILARLFTPGELAYCQAGGKARFHRMAARFAAKEAALKAIGLGLSGVKWIEVEVVRLPSGQPTLHLSDRLLQIAAARSIRSFQLSLSHAQAYAIAQVVALS